VLLGIIEKKSWPHLSGHGTADISISAVTAVVDIGFTVTGGEPGCVVLTDGVNVGNFNIKIHGSESWMINIFIDIFKSKIKDQVTKGIKEGIDKAINDNLNHVLLALPLKRQIANYLLADFTLVDAPRAGASYLVADSKGEFYGLKNHQEAPFQAVALPDLENANVMVQFTIAQYVPDTATFALWKDGILVVNVDDSMVPPDSPIHFNTESFEFIIPPLFKAYPSKPLKARIDPIDTPLVSFEANGMITVNSKLEMVMFVINTATDVRQVFTLGVNVIAKGFVKLVGLNVHVNLTYGNITLSIINTQIGTFDLGPLSDLSLLAVAEGLAFGNDFFKQGIPLPKIDKVDFINPYLGYGNGYIFVNTDIKYTPTTLP